MSKNITQFESPKIITVLFLRFLIPSLSCHKGWLNFKYKNQPMTKKDLLDGLVSKFLPNKRYQMHIMLKKVYLPPVLLKWPFDTMPVKKKKTNRRPT